MGEYYSKAGGSAANTTRGLAGFGVRTQLLGARGFDEWGTLFTSSMKRAGVDVSRLEVKPGPTARSCILSCGGQRTMRTCLAGSPALSADELSPADFAGVQWAYLSAYCCYQPGLLERAVELARAAGCSVALDLASFEVIRSFREARARGACCERRVSLACSGLPVFVTAAAGCCCLPPPAGTDPRRALPALPAPCRRRSWGCWKAARSIWCAEGDGRGAPAAGAAAAPCAPAPAVPGSPAT